MFTIPGMIPIRIHPTFWLLCFGIGFLNTATVAGTLIWAVVVFVSVLVHEFGHALTALAFGQHARIDLVGLGGLTSRTGKKTKLWQDFIIVLDGPLAGLLLAALSYAALLYLPKSANHVLVYGLNVAVIANIFWTVINLLPIQPLDGGRLLSIVLESFLGARGIKFALGISILAAGCFAILAFLVGQMLPGAIFFLLGFESFRTLQGERRMREKDHDTSLQVLLQRGERAFKRKEFPEARALLTSVRETAREGVLYTTATVYLAEIDNQEGHYNEAYQLLKPIHKELEGPAISLFHHLAWQVGDWKMAVQVGDEAYQLFPSYETALTNALCYARLGDAKASFGWLKRSLSDGLPNLSQVIQRQDFDGIRHSPVFEALTQ